MEAVYRRADLFVMPNIHVPGTMEGFGVVMLEAGLCGLPTIAARLEGIEDVIIEGENGHLVESGNPESFVDGITDYVRNRDALPSLASRTESTAMQFTWESIAAQHLRVIDKFI
jgi:phosphatidylinositol alpha-1,6-mannosyltransferase